MCGMKNFREWGFSPFWGGGGLEGLVVDGNGNEMLFLGGGVRLDR